MLKHRFSSCVLAIILAPPLFARTISVQVDVVDRESGHPIANAQVSAWQQSEEVVIEPGPSPGGFTTTVRLEALETLEYRIEAEGYFPARYRMDPQMLAVKDPLVFANQPLKVGLRRGSPVHGTIVDGRGHPIDGVNVTVCAAVHHSPRGHFAPLFDFKTVSDGRFTLPAVPDKTVLTIQCDHPDYPAVGTVIDSHDDVKLTMDRVWKLAGSVVDYRGDAVQGVRLNLVSQQGSTMLASTRTTKQGRYSFDKVRVEDCVLVANADRFAPVQVVIDADHDAPPLDLRLLPGRQVRINVVDPEGQPVLGVDARSVNWREHGGLEMQAQSNPRGQVTFRGAPADDVTYELSHPQYATTQVTCSASGQVTRVTLTPTPTPQQPGTTESPSTSKLLGEALGSFFSRALGSPPTRSTGEKSPSVVQFDPDHPERQLLCFCESDGTVIRPLIDNVLLRHQFDRQGTPDVSADGSTVVYDAWPSEKGWDGWEEARIIVANIDGTGARDLTDGVMPALSPDGKYVTFSRAISAASKEGARGSSIWTMGTNGDLSTRKMVADYGAWGARWSADGRSLVFRGGLEESGRPANGNRLRVYDLVTEKTRDVFTSEQSPFEKLNIHINLSKRGRWALISGKLKNDQNANAVVHLDRGIESMQLIPKHINNVRLRTTGTAGWFPDNRSIMLAGGSDQMSPIRLFLSSQRLEDLSGFPTLHAPTRRSLLVRDFTVTPDGKHLILGIR